MAAGIHCATWIFLKSSAPFSAFAEDRVRRDAFFISMKDRLLFLYQKMFHALGPQHWWPGRTRFEIIVGAILTQNTAWTNVEKAIANLRAQRMLSPDSLKQARLAELALWIKPSGYYHQKAKKLKNFLAYFYHGCNGSLRAMARRETVRLRQELLQVNGIGPETADSIVLYAFGKPVFVVDAYTRRIFSRHGFCRDDTSYEELQRIFTDHLPLDAKLFNEYHALIVNVGKNFCKTKRPFCAQCPLKQDQEERRSG